MNICKYKHIFLYYMILTNYLKSFVTKFCNYEYLCSIKNRDTNDTLKENTICYCFYQK